MAALDLPTKTIERIDAVRRFNRFYTKHIGVLQETLLESGYSLAESRVLYELARREETTASQLASDLGLDAGYLSRILKHFDERGLLRRKASTSDGRQMLISLSAKGRKAFQPLNSGAKRQVADMLATLQDAEQERLTRCMNTIEKLLRPEADQTTQAFYVLRSHRPGDMGWVVHRHGAIYAAEYGWDETFEALVAEICASFIRNLDSKRERCWIAERDGEVIGSVFLVRESDEVAKLRLLLVEASARGLGLGRKLVAECIDFARQAGYKKVTLWTNDVLTAARHIYEQAGFKLIREERHHSFGHPLTGQNWELEITKQRH